MKKINILNIGLFFILANIFLLGNIAYSTGVGIDATRIIYPQGEKSVSVTLRNNDENTNYLTHVSITSDKYPNSFEIVPPLFRLDKMSRQDVRVILAKNDLPQDRESIFYFKARMVPARDKDKEGVIIGFDNIIKLFYRPNNFKITSKEAQSSLIFKTVGSKVEAINQSPYYINLLNISFNNKPVIINTDKKNNMIAPFSRISFDIKVLPNEIVKWSTINDLGGYDVYSAKVQ